MTKEYESERKIAHNVAQRFRKEDEYSGDLKEDKYSGDLNEDKQDYFENYESATRDIMLN